MRRAPAPAALLLPALMLLAACGPAPADDGRPIAVSVVGPRPRLVDPDRGAADAPSAVLLGAVAQGIVRFDAAGQIEPGLAVRWDVSNDGLYYTFRLADDAAIDAPSVARRLRAAIGPRSRNPLKPVLGAIAGIVAVTPRVVELRLSAPRPDFLQLLAQPALAIPGGGGPLAIGRRLPDGAMLGRLAPRTPDMATPGRPGEVRLRGERAALAIARFAAGEAAVVTGGTFADLPVAQAAASPPGALRFDPAGGLFGLAIIRPEGLLASPQGRAALSAAIDRGAIAAALPAPPGWHMTARLVPVPTNEIAASALLPGMATDPGTRRAHARLILDRLGAGAAAPLRVALPPGPGARRLFARIAQDWRAVGIAAEAVPPAAPADLRLIDLVAPGNSASWYLRHFECVRSRPCSVAADQALTAARTALSLADRAALLAEADRRLAAIVPFIPLGTPLRWSLVAPGVPGWRDNALAIHPLDHLRD